MDSIPQDTPKRQCLDCKEFFPSTDKYFHKSPRGRGGLASYCKPCAHARTKRNKQKPEQKIKEQERRKQYYYAHKSERLDAHKRWYAANRDYALAKDRQFRKDHPEILAERWQNWYRTENGKARSRARVRSRTARKRGASGNYTYADIEAMKKRQKNKCHYCNTSLANGYHIEHTIPIIRGGTNDPSNLVLTCPTCNLQKGTKLPHEWYEGGHLL